MATLLVQLRYLVEHNNCSQAHNSTVINKMYNPNVWNHWWESDLTTATRLSRHIYLHLK